MLFISLLCRGRTVACVVHWPSLLNDLWPQVCLVIQRQINIHSTHHSAKSTAPMMMKYYELAKIICRLQEWKNTGNGMKGDYKLV